MAKTFRAVTVSTLSNNGQSTPKYNKPVALNINYDPQGLSVELVSGTDAAIPAVRAPAALSSDDAVNGDAADRSRDRARPGRDITTLTVASRRVDSYFLLARAGAPKTSRSIAGRYCDIILCRFTFFPAFSIYVSFFPAFLCMRASRLLLERITSLASHHLLSRCR